MGILEMLMAQDARDEETKLNAKAYQPLLRQMPTTAAAALGPLLSARDTGTQQQGQGLLAEYLRRQSPGAELDMAQGEQALASGRQDMQTQSYNNQLNAAEEKRRQQLFPGQQQQQRLAIQQQQQGLREGQARLGQLLAPPAPPTDAQIFEQQTGYPLPKDYVAGFNPNSGELEPMPAPNTEADRKAQAEVQAAEKVTRTVTRFLSLADAAGPTGTEFIGPVASQLRKAREDVITAWREQAALGTPTGGELERIESILPDPTGYYRNALSSLGALGTAGMGADYMKQAMLAPYLDMLNTTNTELKAKYKRNWWVSPMPGVAAP